METLPRVTTSSMGLTVSGGMIAAYWETIFKTRQS